MDQKKFNALKKSLPTGYADGLEAMPTEKLKVEVSILAIHAAKVEEERETNEAIVALKNQLKDTVGPFNDTLKALKAKIKYICTLLEERGAA